MSRMDDAAIREAMARAEKAGTPPWGLQGVACLVKVATEDFPRVAAEAIARGSEAEGLRAEVERLTRERDNLDAALDSVCHDVLVSLAGYVGTPAEGYRKAGISWIGAHIRGAREKGRAAEAEVARLRAALDEARTAICETHNPAIGTDPADWIRMLASDLATARAANAVRAEAIPEDAEERITEALANAESAPIVTLWHRECARAAVKALRAAIAARQGGSHAS